MAEENDAPIGDKKKSIKQDDEKEAKGKNPYIDLEPTLDEEYLTKLRHRAIIKALGGE